MHRRPQAQADSCAPRAIRLSHGTAETGCPVRRFDVRHCHGPALPRDRSAQSRGGGGAADAAAAGGVLLFPRSGRGADRRHRPPVSDKKLAGRRLGLAACPLDEGKPRLVALAGVLLGHRGEGRAGTVAGLGRHPPHAAGSRPGQLGAARPRPTATAVPGALRLCGLAGGAMLAAISVRAELPRPAPLPRQRRPHRAVLRPAARRLGLCPVHLPAAAALGTAHRRIPPEAGPRAGRRVPGIRRHHHGADRPAHADRADDVRRGAACPAAARNAPPRVAGPRPRRPRGAGHQGDLPHRLRPYRAAVLGSALPLHQQRLRHALYTCHRHPQRPPLVWRRA